jgi:hypothetical protein
MCAVRTLNCTIYAGLFGCCLTVLKVCASSIIHNDDGGFSFSNTQMVDSRFQWRKLLSILQLARTRTHTHQPPPPSPPRNSHTFATERNGIQDCRTRRGLPCKQPDNNQRPRSTQENATPVASVAPSWWRKHMRERATFVHANAQLIICATWPAAAPSATDPWRRRSDRETDARRNKRLYMAPLGRHLSFNGKRGSTPATVELTKHRKEGYWG